jgi:hypothetical protein
VTDSSHSSSTLLETLKGFCVLGGYEALLRENKETRTGVLQENGLSAV